MSKPHKENNSNRKIQKRPNRIRQTNISRDWSNVIFSDENKINLRGQDSYFKYWGNTNDEKKMLIRNKFNGRVLWFI